jgi:hypothetical protein
VAELVGVHVSEPGVAGDTAEDAPDAVTVDGGPLLISMR